MRIAWVLFLILSAAAFLVLEVPEFYPYAWTLGPGPEQSSKVFLFLAWSVLIVDFWVLMMTGRPRYVA